MQGLRDTWNWLSNTGSMPRWAELLGIVATAGAAFLALVTIIQAKRQAQRSADALIRERRIDFELGVLVDVLELVESSSSSMAGRDARVRAFARTLGMDAVPLLRAATHLDTTEAGKALSRQLLASKAHTTDLDHMREPVIDELVSAIEQRVSERGDR